jgi:hypothetical protein
MADTRTGEYEGRHRCRLLGLIGPGPGQDGFVMRSDRLTAVKFFDRTDRFNRELEVYQVLRDRTFTILPGIESPPLFVQMTACARLK